MELSLDEQQFLTGNIRKTVWKYGIPCAMITLVLSLYNIVDQIFIGNKVGPLGNAATNVIFPLTTIALAFGLLVGSGCAANYSIFLGRGDRKKAAKCVGNSIVFIFLEAVIFTIASICLLPKLVVWFGGIDAVYQYAMDYGFIICLGLPCYMVSIGFSNILRADGRPKIATASTLIGCILNCILDPLFINVFEWGVKGAAWATIIGQVVSCVISTAAIFKLKSVKLEKDDFKPDIRLCGRIAFSGVTEFALNMCSTIIFIVNNNLLTKYGALSVYGAEIPLATYGIVMKIIHIATALSTGMGQGAQPIIGYCYGHGDYQRVKKVIKFSIKQGLVLGFVVWSICRLFPTQLLLLFGEGSDLYVEFGTNLLLTYAALLFLNSLQITMSNILMALGKAYKGAILTITRNLILCVFSGIILCRFIGVEGVMYEGLIADGGSAIVAIILLIFEIKILNGMIKKRKHENDFEVLG